VGGMVQVVNANDYAYMGKWKYDTRRIFANSVNDEEIVTN